LACSWTAYARTTRDVARDVARVVEKVESMNWTNAMVTID
jgi:hypothetical protein